MRLMTICLAALACLACQASDAKPPAPDGKEAKTGEELRIVPDVEKRVTQFAPVPFSADLSALTPEDRQVLDKLVAAAKLMNEIFLRQAWAGNTALRDQLASYQGEHAEATRLYFDVNFGPWDRLAERQPFIGDQPHPSGAGHYPEDMTKEEFEGWIAKHPGDKEALTSTFTEVRRGQDGALVAVPYSREYAEWLKPAAQLLREAAALTSNASLKKFLDLRAAAFESDDYYASDVAWMDLDSPIEVTIGPYETYEDELFSYKAAFEAYVTLRDDAETAKLAKFSGQLQELENSLPFDPRYRNPKLGAASPIRVVNEVFASGEGNSGVQTAAFNLPNDERVVKEKGSKRVMLKNVQDAKFNKTLVPISKVVLDPSEQSALAFESFFTHILCHELMHGLGPHNITVGGQETTVRKQLKELYSAIEEAKADMTGLWALQYMIDRGIIDKGMERTLYTTYLASMFRSVRFGITEAHGRGVAMQFNYLTDEGAIKL